MRTLVAGRGQDVRVGCRGAHVRLVPKREGYISLFCLDAHPTPSPASSAHLEDARLDAHLRILVGFPPPLGLDAGWHGCRRSCGRRRPRSPGLNVRPTCNNDVTGQSGPPPMRRFGRSFTASAPHAREAVWGKFPQSDRRARHSRLIPRSSSVITDDTSPELSFSVTLFGRCALASDRRPYARDHPATATHTATGIIASGQARPHHQEHAPQTLPQAPRSPT